MMPTSLIAAFARRFALLTALVAASAHGQSVPADIYESDNRQTSAKVLPLTDVQQSRNFHTLGDIDWVKLTLQSGQSATVTARASVAQTTNKFRAELHMAVPGALIHQGTTLFGTSVVTINVTNPNPVQLDFYLQVLSAVSGFSGAQSAYTLRAVSGTSAPNQPPTITLTAPTHGSIYTLGQSIALTALASDPDPGGSVHRVDFLKDGALLESDNSAAWSYLWTPDTAGTFVLSARAFDNLGLPGNSNAVTVTVNPAPVPNGTLTTNSPCTLPGPVTPDNCTVQMSVGFSNTPIACVWNRDAMTVYGCWAQGGVYDYTLAAATPRVIELRAHNTIPDSGNLINEYNASTLLGTTTVSGVNNLPPTVTLVSPTHGASYVQGTNINFSAIATDADGIDRVEFVSDGVVIGTAPVAPYKYIWPNAAVGTHVVFARAIDTRNLPGTSSPATITVTPVQTATGTLSTNSPCALPGPTNPDYCTVQMSVGFANTALACVWNREPLGLHGCWDQGGTYPHPWAALSPMTIELRAHATNPALDPGWPGNIASLHSAAPLLASAVIQATAAPSATMAIAATPTANLTAPATTRLSASFTGSPSVVSVVYRHQGQNICAPTSIAPYYCDWSQIAAGSYAVTGVATLSSGSPLTSPVLNLTVVQPTTAYEPPSAASMLSSDAVGATTGSFRVSESGDANYSIPVYTAPSSGGTRPQMALSYSSGSPFGVAGAGWSVQGASGIGRCRKTKEHGDISNPLLDQPTVSLTDADAYCLDGQRLVAVTRNPSGVCATAQAEYRTEVESYRSVCAWNDSANVGGGHAYFAVFAKDGTTSVYGRDQWSPAQGGGGAANYSSRLLANAGGFPRAAITWSISRVEDTAGNYFDYLYSKDEVNGEHYLAEVRYNANRRAGQAPDHAIAFQYESLAADEIEHGRIATASTRLSKVLSAIHSTAANGASLRHYRLRYNAISIGERRTLAGVTECSDAGGTATCYPETVFQWSPASTLLSGTTVGPGGAIDGFEGLGAEKFGDVNGDGLNDIVWVKRESSSDPESDLESFWITATVMRNGVPVPGDDKTRRFDTSIPYSASQNSAQRSWHLLDYNGDGRDDLIRLGTLGRSYQWLVHLAIPKDGSSTDYTFDTAGISLNFPATADNRATLVLSDFTGDGLPDALLAGGDANLLEPDLYLYPMQRDVGSGLPYRFGDSIPVLLNSDNILLPGDQGDRTTLTWSFGQNTRALNRFQSVDVNADGRSDLSVVLYTGYLQGPVCTPQVVHGAPSFFTDADLAPASSDAPDGGGSSSYLCYIPHPAVLKAVGLNANGQFEFAAYAPRLGQGCFVDAGGNVSGSLLTGSIQHGDFSGDGYADVLLKQINPAQRTNCNADQSDSDTFAFRVNEGNGYAAAVDIGALDPVSNTDRQDGELQFLDVNGDARSDLVYPRYYGGGDSDPNNRYKVRYWNGNSFATASEFPGYSTGYISAPRGDRTWKAFLIDLDNDGWVEGLRLKPACASAPCNTWSVLSSSNARKPQQRVELIITGLGAATQISYAPLSDASVYARGIGTAAMAPLGRGSPVFDLSGPLYVVKSAESSAPTSSNPNALAKIRYFYRGARMQGGGRGFLGFEELHTYADVLQAAAPAQRMRTVSRYIQAFPLIGAPIETVQELVNVGSDGLAIGPVLRLLSRGTTTYYQQSVPATPQPISQLKQMDDAYAYDLQSGTQVSGSRTQYQQYDAYGSVLAMSTANLDALGSPIRTTTTTNVYAQDNPNRWLLGRLTRTTVTHWVDGLGSVVRASDFDYDPTTGLLWGEVVEPARPEASIPAVVDESLRKAYELDIYGNRLRTAVCSNAHFGSRSACLDTSSGAFKNYWDVGSEQKHIKRIGRVVYDSRGRFARQSHIWATQASSIYPVERLTQWTDEASFDRFANPLLTQSANGGIAQAQYGALGREHARWSSDGAATETRYAWCGSVTCPSGMRYRSEVRVRGGASSWTYHDYLGRARIKISQGYSDPNDPEAAALGFSTDEYIAVRSEFDLLGRAVKSSEPYFAQGPLAAAPEAPANGAVLYWTQTSFDALGRATRVDLPETGAYTASSYNGLTTTTSTLACASGCPLQTRTETRNFLGQLVETSDANNVKVCNTYDVQGRLTQVDQGSSCLNPTLAMRITVAYNKVGHKTSMFDPDKGAWAHSVNALGEIVQQTDAKGQRILSSYDAQGRLWRRQDFRADNSTESIASFEFDTAANGLGAMASESISAGGFSKSYSFDSLGRPSTSITTLDGVSYSTSASYDGFGRGDTATDASGDAIRTEYTERGFAKRMREAAGAASGAIINEIRRVSARGQILEERRGGLATLATLRDYYAPTGRLKSIVSGGGAIQNLYYEWDFLGNLTFRRDQTTGSDMDERFAYDVLNRLTTVRLSRRAGGPVVTNQVTQSLGYDDWGNILNKLDVGSYSYGQNTCGRAAGPHAATTAGSVQYCYDANGNQTSSTDGRSLVYSVFDKPLSVSKTASAGAAGDTVAFSYGTGRELVRRVDGNGSQVTRFVGGIEVLVNDNATRRQAAGMIVRKQGGTRSVSYVFNDHLGSVGAIVDASGAVEQRQSFDAHGARRAPASWETWTVAQQLNFDASRTRKGYTGHEGVDATGLIHFGGRMYDPRLGRFIQADPLVEDANLANGLNRYTYVLNNPLSLTDPSGYLSWSEARPVVAIVVAIVMQNYAQGLVGIQALMAQVAIGATSGAISGGSRGAVMGAFSAAMFYGIGSAFQDAAFLNNMSSSTGEYGGVFGTNLTGAQFSAKVALHGMAGGVMSKLGGGKFGHGFVSAAGTELSSAVIGQIGGGAKSHRAHRIVVAGVIGGTISELTGGKFANGAMTGAFSRAFNAEEHSESEEVEDSGRTIVAAELNGIGATFLDSEMNTAVAQWVLDCAEDGITLEFNSAYRNDAAQAALHDDPDAITPATVSLHSAGLAVDIQYSSLLDVTGGLTGDQQRAHIRENATANGLSWGGNFRTPDRPHFYIDPGTNRAILIATAARQVAALTEAANSE